MNATDELGTIGAKAAMRAAAAYLLVHELEADVDALIGCLRSWCRIKLPQALRDAKEAIDAGMGRVAEATFCATMAAAGIEAAREAGFPKPGTAAKYLPSAL